MQGHGQKEREEKRNPMAQKKQKTGPSQGLYNYKRSGSVTRITRKRKSN